MNNKYYFSFYFGSSFTRIIYNVLRARIAFEEPKQSCEICIRMHDLELSSFYKLNAY